MSKPEVKTVTEYLDTDYRQYAVYVVEERAIPSVIDGLKPTQRKVVFVADRVWKNGSEKPMKVFQLTGKVASDAYYHHGDCLDIDTSILLEDGTYLTIRKWLELGPTLNMRVLAYDESSKSFVSAIAHSPRLANTTNCEYSIEMEDGSVIKCTSNHPFLTKRGWVTADSLLDSDEIISVKDHTKSP